MRFRDISPLVFAIFACALLRFVRFDPLFSRDLPERLRRTQPRVSRNSPRISARFISAVLRDFSARFRDICLRIFVFREMYPLFSRDSSSRYCDLYRGVRSHRVFAKPACVFSQDVTRSSRGWPAHFSDVFPRFSRDLQRISRFPRTFRDACRDFREIRPRVFPRTALVF